MSLLPVPDLMLDSIYDLTPDMLTDRGVRFVVLDIDNTIAPYTVHEADDAMRAWVDSLRGAGLALYVLSNNRGHRPETFSSALGLPFQKKAWKPFPKQARAVMASQGFAPEETAFIGDQIYTDVCCAKWCGAYAVLVRPIEFHRFILKFRYWLEWPFRAVGKR
jgi:HAD superfamily phosphatase (TIGR01668 family)